MQGFLSRGWDEEPGKRDGMKRAAGVVLRKLRKKAKLSQEEVADAIGMSRQHLTRLEGGHHFPTLGMLKKLARFYGLDVSELMRRIEERERKMGI